MITEYIRNNFKYIDGCLIRNSDKKRIGTIVKRTDTIKYKNFIINTDDINKTMYLHRMIYIYHNGDIPDKMVIDHIDGNGLNNNIKNLQAITHSENLLKSKLEKTNKTGQKNIAYDKSTKKKYRPYAMVNGKRKYGTRCTTLDEAIKVRDKIMIDAGRTCKMPNQKEFKDQYMCQFEPSENEYKISNKCRECSDFKNGGCSTSKIENRYGNANTPACSEFKPR